MRPSRHGWWITTSEPFWTAPFTGLSHLEGDGVHHTVHGIARLHNLTLAG
ncbi:hypothetical protein [Streptomyces halobius]|uniref:Uncharacterized protein n=1 Tax=Streptomyces halobius TaxID=2879846 RepID=A0ABY4M502_9ACTN|nr:hypothetical protein [Streptomyces halobius]UQA92844.1 hypothetical protein K9S39_14280 [Streptomyces halobius]